jgi:hypothetical protein
MSGIHTVHGSVSLIHVGKLGQARTAGKKHLQPHPGLGRECRQTLRWHQARKGGGASEGEPYSAPRNRRPSFTCERLFFSFNRRTLDPRVGLVARRFLGGLSTARIIAFSFR